MDPTYPLTSHRAKRFAAAGSCTRQHLLRASLTKLTGAPLSDKNMDLIGIIQYPWKPCSIRLALSCSSVTACSRLMPLLLRPGFHAQVHLLGYSMTGRQSGINLIIFKKLLRRFRSCKVLNCKENLGTNNKEELQRKTNFRVCYPDPIVQGVM
nr:uncharacterized protein LOC116827401 isoform X1 [Chelonoidis abingdonii]